MTKCSICKKEDAFVKVKCIKTESAKTTWFACESCLLFVAKKIVEG